MSHQESEHDSSLQPSSESSAATFHQEVERLHHLTIMVRWLVVAALWLTIGALSLWQLSYSIALVLEHFTWAAIRYGLAFNRLAAIGLALCVGTTVAVLLWQSQVILWGIPKSYRQRLEKQVYRIRQQGPSHPLWKFVCQPQGE